MNKYFPTEMKRLVKIPEIFDDCFLYFVEHKNHLPFSIKRVYFILKSHSKLSRGFHAHKSTNQVLFCIQGSIKITIDDGKKRKDFLLDHPGTGLLIERMIWHEMSSFKDNTILLVLASRIFDPRDYIRDYDEFLKFVHGQ